MTSKLAWSWRPAPDLRLTPEVGVVSEPEELVHPLPEDSGGGGIGPPGSCRKQPTADPETDKYKFSISTPSPITIIIIKYGSNDDSILI